MRQGRLLRLALVLLVLLADLEWRAGRWAEAEAYAEEAKSILDDALPGGAVVVYYHHVLVAGSRGRVDEARRFAAEGLRLTELRNDHLNPSRIRWALGHVELAAGDPAAALQSLESLPQALDTFGIGEPGWQPILPDVIEALCQRVVSMRRRRCSGSSSSRRQRSSTVGPRRQLYGVAPCCCSRASAPKRRQPPPNRPPRHSRSSASRSTELAR